MKQFLLILLLTLRVNAELMDYVKNIGSYLGFQQENHELEHGEFSQKIPYEVSVVDENFIREATKLTGLALSELDSCQHRVVLKLRSDCHKLNDESLSKMAVHLLNCQSYVEGRKTYPCTEEMSLKQCTSDMDSDTWTSYHLMTNRARAVCYSIRQSQFRGLAEHTINRLMDAAQNQLTSLGKIEHNQEQIREAAENTYEAINRGHEVLKKQQEDLQKAQLHEMLTLEDNIQRLLNEKKMIAETHNYLIGLTTEIKKSLQESASQLEYQNEENKENYEKLILDISSIHERAQQIFNKIEESSQLLMQQNEELTLQYQSTLKNLNEVNKTVHNLVQLVGGTRKALEERLNWVTTALGGTDLALERLYHILGHSIFMIMAMITCAFLSVETSTRLITVVAPSLNLFLALLGENCMELSHVGLVIIVFVAIQKLLHLLMKPEVKGALPWIKEKLTPIKSTKNPEPDTSVLNNTYSETYKYTHNAYNDYQRTVQNDDKREAEEEEEERDSFSVFRSPTPPLSRIGSRSRSNTPAYSTTGRLLCTALTKFGTPCKLTALHGRDFCSRHLKGSSIIT